MEATKLRWLYQILKGKYFVEIIDFFHQNYIQWKESEDIESKKQRTIRRELQTKNDQYMNYFDLNKFLSQSSQITNNDIDSFDSTQNRNRAFSDSSHGSQDCISSQDQNNLKDLNLLLTMLTQNQQPLHQEKSKFNSDASFYSEDFKFDFNRFPLFNNSNVIQENEGQIFIPKPIRQSQKISSVFYNLRQNNSLLEQQQTIQDLLIEASLNIFQNLLRNESLSKSLSSPQEQSESLNGSPSQFQIMYQPNIIFGVQLTPKEIQKRRELRLLKIKKYLTKKQTRKWDALRYEVRKKIAKARQRVKGRFIKKEKLDLDDSKTSNPELKSQNSTQISQ